MMERPNKSLQATRDGRLSSASRFTLVGPECLSTGRSAASASAIDALRLGVFATLRFAGVDFNAETQRRKDARRTCPGRGCLERSPARDRREPGHDILEC